MIPRPNGEPRRATVLGSAAVQGRQGVPESAGKKLGAIAIAIAMVATGVLMSAPAAIAAPPPGQDFNVSQGDLEFIIKQIEISEAHAEDTLTDPGSSPLCKATSTFDIPSQTHFDLDGDPCVGSPLLPFGLRTVDGRWNNLMPGQDGYGTAAAHGPAHLRRCGLR